MQAIFDNLQAGLCTVTDSSWTIVVITGFIQTGFITPSECTQTGQINTILSNIGNMTVNKKREAVSEKTPTVGMDGRNLFRGIG